MAKKNDTNPTCNGDKNIPGSHFRLIHLFILLYAIMLLYTLHLIEAMSNCSCYLYFAPLHYLQMPYLYSSHPCYPSTQLATTCRYFYSSKCNAMPILQKWCFQNIAVFNYIFLLFFLISSDWFILMLCTICLKNAFISSIPFLAECDCLSCYSNGILDCCFLKGHLGSYDQTISD